jgi:hypothetical protein
MKNEVKESIKKMLENTKIALIKIKIQEQKNFDQLSEKQQDSGIGEKIRDNIDSLYTAIKSIEEAAKALEELN